MPKHIEVPLINKVNHLEYIHAITPEQEEAFIKAINLADLLENTPKTTIAILFSGAGYEADLLLREISRHNPLYSQVEIKLYDQSKELLDNSAERLQIYKGSNITITNIQQEIDVNNLPAWEENSLDIIVCKQGLHEVTPEIQRMIVEKAFIALRPGGRIVVWETLNGIDPASEPKFDFNQFIADKDALLSVESRVYTFLSGFELNDLLFSAGFNPVMTEFLWIRTWDTLSRLPGELSGNLSLLAELNYIVDNHFADPVLQDNYNYQISRDEAGNEGRSFDIPTAIIFGKK